MNKTARIPGLNDEVLMEYEPISADPESTDGVIYRISLSYQQRAMETELPILGEPEVKKVIDKLLDDVQWARQHTITNTEQMPTAVNLQYTESYIRAVAFEKLLGSEYGLFVS